MKGEYGKQEMRKIGIDSPDILYMDCPKDEKKKRIIPRTEVRLKCVDALTKEALGENIAVPYSIAIYDVVDYLHNLARSAVAIINPVNNDEACSYTICGVEKEDDLSFSAVLSNALQSAVASAAYKVTLVFYYPERKSEELVSPEDLEVMSVLIQMFYICAIRVSDVIFANAENKIESARERYPEYFKDIYLDSYLNEIRRNMPEILKKEGVLKNE